MPTYASVEEVLGSLGIGPGEHVTINANSGFGQPNMDYVYISANDLAKFEIGQSVRICKRDVTGDSIQLFEDRVVIGKGATYLVLDNVLLDSYLIATDNPAVYSMVRANPLTQPTYLDFARIIEEIEDQIDHQTHHCWRERYSVEWHQFAPASRYQAYPAPFLYATPYHENSTYWGVQLRHRDLKQLSDTPGTYYPGDALRVWRGSKYEEWVNTADPDYVAGFVEDRATGDYWLDYENGTLYFVGDRPARSDMALKIRYRYGQQVQELDLATALPVSGPAYMDIKRACRLKAQAEILRNERFSIWFPGGDENGAMGPTTASRDMDAEADRILDRHTEVVGWTGREN